jgi:hypothetical protein
MMRDHYLGHSLTERTKFFPNAFELFSGDTTSFNRQRACGVDAKNSDLFVNKRRLKIIGDITAVAVERSQEASKGIMEGDVVVARDNNLRRREGIQESPRFFELLSAGSLCQVTRNHHKIRLDPANGFDKRVDHCIVNATEMDVGKMSEYSH